MKPKTLIVGAVIVIAVSGAAVLSAQHYTSYKTKKSHQAAVNAQAAADAKVAEEKEDAHAARLQAAYDHERIECGKGLGAYGKLSATLQKTTPAPVCGPAVVQ